MVKILEVMEDLPSYISSGWWCNHVLQFFWTMAIMLVSLCLAVAITTYFSKKTGGGTFAGELKKFL